MADKVINEGGSGFHLWTVVTDGYNNIIAEDEHGHRLAEVSCEGHDEDDPAPFAELARRAFAVANGDAKPLDSCADRD